MNSMAAAYKCDAIKDKGMNSMAMLTNLMPSKIGDQQESFFTGPAGQRRYYVYPKLDKDGIAHGPGKWCCKKCYIHYRSQNDTVIRNVPAATAAPESIMVPDINSIRQSVNESQRQGSHMPRGRVTAIGGSMPPPPLRSSSAAPGPIVSSPLFDFNQHAAIVSRSSSVPAPQVMGYSAAHTYHAQQTHEWSQRAYKGILNSMPGGIVTLNLGVYEPIVDAKGRPVLVQQIFETLEVHSSILDIDLVREIKQKLLEPLRVDKNRPLVYCGDRFFKPSKKKSDPTLIFNAGPPQTFGLVFPRDVWDNIQAQEDMEVYDRFHRLAAARDTSAGAKRKTGASRSTNFGSGSEVVSPVIPTKKLRLMKGKGKDQGSTTSQHRVEEVIDVEDSDPEVDIPPMRAPAFEHSRRSTQSNGEHDDTTQHKCAPVLEHWRRSTQSNSKHHEAITLDAAAEATQAPKRAATQLKAPPKPRVSFASARTPKHFVPLDPASIRRGFQEGGASSRKEGLKKTTAFVSEEIRFFPLPRVAFKDLMSYPTQDCKGTFKTANLASLEFDNVRSLVGLGSVEVDKFAVALKRPFLDVKAASKRPGLRSVNAAAPVSRLTVTDEQHAVTGEAKLLVWANALLEFAYDFIFDYAQTNNAPPGVEDFIRCGREAIGNNLSGKTINTTSNIPFGGDVAWYPSRATTILERDDPEYELAEFLMFMQHAQYQITHGTAYISDFQGVGTTLTDPQIMTKPDLGSSLFGDGNLGEAFSKFPVEHICAGNRWCEWFKLEKLQADEGCLPLE
ncbi:hypothetical protein BDZ97DRAFT_2061944 [Flammula alnicola]|nr:hypothetical protein BDZ97DRAFT_2061944 [Flammula alnicola]